MTREEAIAYGKDYYRDLTTACCEIDKKHKEFVKMSLKALEQEPCNDAISRQAVNDAIYDVLVKYIPILYGSCEKIPLEFARTIIQLPPVNPQQKTGHWIDHQEGEWIYAKCSECQTIHDTQTNYCPNCGCRMESEG